MTVKIFKSEKTNSIKEIEQHFTSSNIPYEVRNLEEDKLQWSEFCSMVGLMEDELEELLPKYLTKEMKLITDQIDFDTITLKEFYEIASNNPTIIRTPLIMSKNNIMRGFRKDKIGIFDTRSSKKARFSQILEAVRLKERYELEEELGYSLN